MTTRATCTHEKSKEQARARANLTGLRSLSWKQVRESKSIVALGIIIIDPILPSAFEESDPDKNLIL